MPEKLILENDYLRVCLLPEIGGKIASITEKATGHDFLLPPSRPYGSVHPPVRFEDSDRGGFDECMPGIAASVVRGSVPAVPDHGELWQRPWEVLETGERITLEAAGHASGMQLRRTAFLCDKTLYLRYRLTNLSSESRSWMWSAHPLLAVDEGDRILLPDEVKSVYVEYSQENVIRARQHVGWPVHESAAGLLALNEMPELNGTTAYKLYASIAREGWCALHRKYLNRWLRFRFNHEELPWVGVWISAGAWPAGEGGRYTVALEPCTASCDSLLNAIDNGTARTLASNASFCWELAIDFLEGLS